MAGPAKTSNTYVVIGTSESGPRTFKVTDSYVVQRDPAVPLPTPTATTPAPSPVFVETAGTDANKTNNWVRERQLEVNTTSYVESLKLDNQT